jgi:hypothetical protein
MRPVCTQDELADPYRMHLYKRRWAELKPISTRVVSQYGQRLSVCSAPVPAQYSH